MFKIEKQYSLDWAHRVYNQCLDGKMCETSTPVQKCLRLHGHTGTFIIGLKSNQLYNDMVIDYNMLGFVKKTINDYLDHRLMIYQNDPLIASILVPQVSVLKGETVKEVKLDPIADLSVDGKFTVSKIDLSEFADRTDSPHYQMLDAILVTSFNSASEMIAMWMYYLVKNRIDKYNAENPDRNTIQVDFVTYKETPTSAATYCEN